MRRISTRLFPFAGAIATSALILLKLTGCGGGDGGDPNGPKDQNPPPGVDGGPETPGDLTVAPGPSRGSAIAVSADDAIVVAVNRDVGSITGFKASYPEDGSPGRREPRQAREDVRGAGGR
jgi:hypothetical protein